MAIAPIGPFVRFVVMASAAVYSNWDTIASQFDRQQAVGDIPIIGMYSQHIFQMRDGAGAYTDREKAMFGVHWINTTGGDLDVTWITADFTAVESACATMWTALAAQFGPEYRLVEHRWYQYGPGVLKPNPPVRVNTLGSPMAGTGSAPTVHQAACTVTLRTPLRRHWGRIYLPVSSQVAGTGGQWPSGNVDTICSAAKTFLTASAASQGIVPVVYDRQRGSVLGVTSYEVDSVPDIIRRRRPRTTAYKKILTS